MRKNALLLSSLAMLASAPQGSSQAVSGTLGTLITPTGKIFCEVYRLANSINPALNGTGLTCEVAKITAPIPPRAKDCEFDWGYRFFISERGPAARACYSDVLYRPNMTRLEYGQTRRIAGFTCDLTTARLRCVNLDQRGFELSKARQVFF